MPTSTLTIYSVPLYTKLQLFKSCLFENLTNGINVRQYKDGYLSNSNPVNNFTFYDSLFTINIITINNTNIQKGKYGLVSINNFDNPNNIYINTFDIYLVNNNNEKIKYDFYSSVEDINEFKKILDTLNDLDYCIFIPGKYIQLTDS
tara:strand:- start:54 stop:494 length:441 start_codon:yes stop_codon:yes gene_type:complete